MYKIVQILFITVLIWYLFSGFNIKNIDMSLFSYIGVILTFFSLLISQMILSLRWMVMSNLSFGSSFEVITISSALNMILPARLGEISKAYYLKKFYDYNYNKTFSLIFVERFFDIIALFFIMCYWLYNFFSDTQIKNATIFLAFFIVIILVLFNTKKFYYFLKKIPFKFLRVYLQKLYRNIYRLLKSPYEALFFTFLVWFLYFLSYFLFFTFGANFNLSHYKMLELFIFSTIALSVPILPAGIGTFEGAIVFFLTTQGVDKETAFVSAVIYHALIFIVDFLLFFIILLYKDIYFKDLIKR